jgi:hypothetical protein
LRASPRPSSPSYSSSAAGYSPRSASPTVLAGLQWKLRGHSFGRSTRGIQLEDLPKSVVMQPGPGAYETLPQSPTRKASPAFSMARAERHLCDEPHTKTPGPGAYEVSREFELPVALQQVVDLSASLTRRAPSPGPAVYSPSARMNQGLPVFRNGANGSGRPQSPRPASPSFR